MASASRPHRSTSTSRRPKTRASYSERCSPTALLYLPPLYPYQRKLLEDPARDAACVSATQIGKTFALACWILVCAWQDQKRIHPWWWTGPTYAQVMNGFQYIVALATAAGIVAGQPTVTPFPRLRLLNGALLEFRSRDEAQNLMGTTIAGGVVDEAGMLTAEQQAAISTRRAETMGPLRYIGNPGIVSGPFRRICAKGESAMAGGSESPAIYSLHRWTWRDRYEAMKVTDPRRAEEYAEFVEQERASLVDYEFRRLYEAEWTEDEAAVFPGAGVEPVSGGDPLATGAPGETYSIGVDVGQMADYMVAVAISESGLRADAMDRFRGIPYPQAVDRLIEFGRRFPGRFIVETNGPGIAVYQEMQRRSVEVDAFETTGRSKEAAIQSLAVALCPARTSLRLAAMQPLQHELQVFRYWKRATGATVNYHYAATEGEHDDCVMALALAYHGIEGTPNARLMASLRADMARRKAEREGRGA